MKKLIFFIAFISFNAYSQRTSTFKILDSITKTPIAFANIIFDNDNYSGTISDIDGTFSIKPSTQNVTISYVGYETLTVNVESFKTNTILLKSKIDELDEVIINSDYNPAIAIMKKVIANKDLNNPENINSFSYKAYNKVFFDFIGSGELDSINDFFEDKHVFINETISRRNYIKPDLKEDIILATKVSGFKDPSFGTLATDFQPFSFYKDVIDLFEIKYLNPISNGSIKKYAFKLEDEFIQNKDTVFIISFKPKKGKNFDGLKGLLYVNSNKYAIQNVDAEPYLEQKTTIKIQQKYALVDSTYWFPQQLNFVATIGNGDFSMRYTGKSYFDDIATNTSLNRKDFSFESVTFSKDATKKSDQFWAANRRDSLNNKEHITYKFLDSIGDKFNFDGKLKLFSSIATGRYPFKYIDLDLTKIVAYNKYEKLRLGAGFITNDDLFKNLYFGGFFGYGFGDKASKYGGHITAKIPGKRDISFTLSYENNLREAGTNLLEKNYNLIPLRNILAERMDNIKALSLESNLKLFRNFYWTFELSTAEIVPKYEYQFFDNNQLITAYNNTEFKAGFSYFVREEVVNAFNTKLRTYSDFPVLNFTYSKGLKNVFDGDFSYNKYEFSINHTFNITNVGKTRYRLEAAHVDANIPYGLLLTGEGTYDVNYPIIIHDHFQTSQPYEFLSNSYINLFTTHDFGGLLFKSGRFQPDIILHNNLGYGSLSDNFRHQNIIFKEKDEVFLETGLELRNIIKLNYFDMGSFGLGLGTFYRYGYHNLPKTSDNWVFKFAAGFTFK
ncbi:DUF5686 family protein [uncultured Psychroserpens sp.]|uniref:DUF5686 family protein n=1 Tax=uncultured Psychroserpens sp. TaxID=255436 RepID=UPI002608E5C4|nr:DUF5686 family protein [uncultured Psychroserpens sp.]